MQIVQRHSQKMLSGKQLNPHDESIANYEYERILGRPLYQFEIIRYRSRYCRPDSASGDVAEISPAASS